MGITLWVIEGTMCALLTFVKKKKNYATTKNSANGDKDGGVHKDEFQHWLCLGDSLQ